MSDRKSRIRIPHPANGGDFTIDELASWMSDTPDGMRSQWKFMQDKHGKVTRASLRSYIKLRHFPGDSAEPDSKIYFLHAEKAGLIKIGFSVHSDARVRDLDNMSPIPLKLLTRFWGGKITERNLHEKFKHLRVRGEWFRATKTLLRFVESFACEPEEDDWS